MLKTIAALAALFFLGQGVQAQGILNAAKIAKDLAFPEKPSTLSMFSSPSMALYKPNGAGPFPAMVISHQCGGLREKQWTNQSILQAAKTAVDKGYVALVLDHFDQRGIDSVCSSPKGGLNFARGVRDTLQAADHLRKFDFVDPNRIALVGYSWGAMNAIFASGKHWGDTLSTGKRFDAAVSHYPGCALIRPASGPPYEVVNPDIDKPLLVLMAQLDTETPAEECSIRLEAAKLAGAPIQWHVYPEAYHCWDCKNLHNFSKTNAQGTKITYKFDEAVTSDAIERMFRFLDIAMPAK